MTKFIDRGDVHYRIAGLSLDTARVACVQDFDYYDYEGFYTEELFRTEQEAEDWLTIEKITWSDFGSSSRLDIINLIHIIQRLQDRIDELEG